MKTDSDQRIAEKIFQIIDLKDKRVLEVGCGNGRISSLLAPRAEKLIAIDPDKLKIEAAKARGKHLGRPIKLTADQKEEIRKRSAAGEKPPELSKAFNVSRGTIYNVIKD